MKCKCRVCIIIGFRYSPGNSSRQQAALLDIGKSHVPTLIRAEKESCPCPFSCPCAWSLVPPWSFCPQFVTLCFQLPPGERRIALTRADCLPARPRSDPLLPFLLSCCSTCSCADWIISRVRGASHTRDVIDNSSHSAGSTRRVCVWTRISHQVVRLKRVNPLGK